MFSGSRVVTTPLGHAIYKRFEEKKQEKTIARRWAGRHARMPASRKLIRWTVVNVYIGTHESP